MLIKPIIDKQSYFRLMTNALFDYWRAGIYIPLLQILHNKRYVAYNSKDELLEALESGVVYYDNRAQGFRATKRFNNKVAKRLEDMGAKFNARQKCYKISFDKLPTSLLVAIAQSDAQFSKRIELIRAFLTEVEGNIELITESMVFDDQLSTVLSDAGQQIRQTVRRLHIIEPELSPMQRQVFIDKYTNNIRTKIKSWTPQQMQSMRQKIEKLVLDGFREDAVERLFLQENNKFASRAKFWARNETSLVLSEFKRQQYTAMGFTRFVWKTRKDSTVRDDHRELESRIFSYDNPPIIDKRTGQTGLPGQAYNCRCVAIPVV